MGHDPLDAFLGKANLQPVPRNLLCQLVSCGSTGVRLTGRIVETPSPLYLPPSQPVRLAVLTHNCAHLRNSGIASSSCLIPSNQRTSTILAYWPSTSIFNLHSLSSAASNGPHSSVSKTEAQLDPFARRPLNVIERNSLPGFLVRGPVCFF